MSEQEAKQMTEQEAQDAVVEIAEGSVHTIFRGKDIRFRQLTLGESSRMTHIFQKEVALLTMEEGAINEAMIQGIVAKKIRELGLDHRIMDDKFRMQILIGFYEKVGEDILPDPMNPDMKLVAENVQLIADKFTSEELEILNQVNAAVELANTLEMSSVETKARATRLKYEMVIVTEDIEGNPIWGSFEELENEIEDNELRSIFREYKIFKEGPSLDFLSESPPPPIGKTSGTQPGGKRRKSSKKKSSSGPKPKK